MAYVCKHSLQRFSNHKAQLSTGSSVCEAATALQYFLWRFADHSHFAQRFRTAFGLSGDKESAAVASESLSEEEMALRTALDRAHSLAPRRVRWGFDAEGRPCKGLSSLEAVPEKICDRRQTEPLGGLR